MVSSAHDDVRRLLKEFGVSADETIMAYIIEQKPKRPLQIRIVLEDVTEYDAAPPQVLRLEVSGTVTPG